MTAWAPARRAVAVSAGVVMPPAAITGSATVCRTSLTGSGSSMGAGGKVGGEGGGVAAGGGAWTISRSAPVSAACWPGRIMCFPVCAWSGSVYRSTSWQFATASESGW
ncbi:hypothetical protein SHO565_59650 [Streptomyces sp. HO565]